MAKAPLAILYRILGNDLPPRYAKGQTLAQLRFLLEYEPELPGLEKRWILNRIVCDETRQAYQALLEAAGHAVEEISFCLDEYRQVWTDLGDTPDEWHPWNPAFEELHPFDQSRTLEYIGRHKNLYLMNNNGARNLAIERGLADAAWVLPWDGGCFLPLQAWQALSPLLARSDRSYAVVPMMRLAANAQAIAEVPPDDLAWDEPQLCFSRQAQQHFDPALRYGSMPKAMLLRRLAVPGPWLEWNAGILPWERPDETPVPDRQALAEAGWVFRLCADGQGEAHRDLVTLQCLRFDSIRRFTQQVDLTSIRQALIRHFPGSWMTTPYQASKVTITSTTPNWEEIPIRYLSDCANEITTNPAAARSETTRQILTLWFGNPETALRPEQLYPLEQRIHLASHIANLFASFEVFHRYGSISEHEARAISIWAEELLNTLADGGRDFIWRWRHSAACNYYHITMLAIGAYLGKGLVCSQVINNITGLFRYRIEQTVQTNADPKFNSDSELVASSQQLTNLLSGLGYTWVTI